MTGRVTKFFIANILEGCRPWDLASILKEYVDLSGTYIARKRNKDGLKFGFVSFKGVVDSKEMEKKLKGIKLGPNTLKINVARFAKENEKVETGGEKTGIPVSRADKGIPVNLKFNGAHIRPGCSYSMALNQNSIPRPVDGYEAEIKIDAGAAALDRKDNRDVVARVRDFKTLVSIKQLLSEAGFDKVDIQYVGGLNILLGFEGTGSTTDFCNRDSEWNRLFSRDDTWVG
ncbi:putative nucleotide-binding alpha-beta plait domain superfamily, RNA-binding domain superfamily [Helianthus annuus]|nr:putative nucleotide-binding alpha-beta plait domain superfamily, RNA-binding domain superfamily [Helianthus annuus]